MDQVLRELERQLTGEAGQIVRDLINGGARPLSAQELRTFLTLAIVSATDRELIIRFLMMAGRAGLLDLHVVLSSIAGASEMSAEAVAAAEAASAAAAAEAEAAAVAAGAAAAEAEGAAAAGAATGGALTAAAALAMILALLYALWSIAHEVNLVPHTPTVGGVPCGLATPGGQLMARRYRTVSAWGIGQKTALDRATRRAEAICNADSAHCTGGCPAGKTCKPSTAIDRVDIFPAIVATRVVIGFTCPCVCA